MKKNKIIKPRHKNPLNKRDLFPKKALKADFESQMAYEILKKKFPNPKERQAYIQSLLDGLEKTESQEHTQEYIDPAEADKIHEEAVKNRTNIPVVE